MNKKASSKISFLILLIFVLFAPIFVNAATPKEVVCAIKSTIFGIATLLIVIGWAIAGILYLTSMGGARMELAKKALFAAVIGTALVILAAVAWELVSDLLGLTGQQNPWTCP